MKRAACLLLAAVFFLAGCAGKPANPDVPDRTAVLPDDYVSRICGAGMRLMHDEQDEASGSVRWVWEETGASTALLSVEIRFPPADCDALYNAAQSSDLCKPISCPPEATACYDGRAAHIRFGQYYVRIAMLGVREEGDALGLLAAKLVLRLGTKQ